MGGSPRSARPHVQASGVILAAGRSSRMEGRHKLLRNFHGVPVIRRVAATALDAGLHPVVVVTRLSAADIRTALAGLDLLYATVASGREGRLVSAVTGIEAVLKAVPGSAGAMILLGDEPGVTEHHMAAVFAAAGQPAVPSRVRYTDREGHPVFVPAEFLRLVPALARGRPPESRLWDVLLEHCGPCRVATLGEAAPIDIDTEEDMTRALDRGLAD